jgi:hypothetical protein
VIEYARLVLLRGRIRQGRPSVPPHMAFPAGPKDDVPAQLADDDRLERQVPLARRAAGAEPPTWACPAWLRPYLGLLTGVRGESVEDLVNDRSADAESDPARAWRVDCVRAQVRLLTTLYAQGLLGSASGDGGRTW